MCACVRLFVTPGTVACQALLSMGFPMDRILEYWSIDRIHRILEWAAISSSRESSWAKDWTWDSCVSSIDRWIFLPLSHQGSPCKDEEGQIRLRKHRNTIYLVSKSWEVKGCGIRCFGKWVKRKEYTKRCQNELLGLIWILGCWLVLLVHNIVPPKLVKIKYDIKI